MSAYRDPTFDQVSSLEKKRGAPLAMPEQAKAFQKDARQVRWEKRKKIRRIMQKIMSK